MALTNYLNSQWADNDGTVNNLTLDRQNNGQLKALRAATAKAITDYPTQTFTEEGFLKCRKMFLDTILRMARGVSDQKGNFALDTTSEAHGIAPGRHLAADALPFSEFRDHNGIYFALIEAELQDVYGSEYIPYDQVVYRDENTNSSPVVSPIMGYKFIPSMYPDHKYSMKKFSGSNDMKALTLLKDWET